MSNENKTTEEPQTPAIEPMLSMASIATLMQVSPRTIRQWRAEGYLPSPDLVHGRVMRWRQSTIQSWINAQSAGAGRS